MPRPMVSVPIVVAAKIGERTSRRLTSAISWPQLPPRRHEAAGRALGRAVGQRVDKRAEPKCHEMDLRALFQRVAGAIDVRLDHRVAHFVAAVGRIETLQEPEPALRYAEHAMAPHLTSSGSRPPTRAARISTSSRRASARATRMPALVMR